MHGRWTIGKKLFTGLGVLIALLMASGATTLWTTRSMNERLVNTGEKTVRRIRLAERAQAEPLRMYIAEQMMLLARAGGDVELAERVADRDADDGPQECVLVCRRMCHVIYSPDTAILPCWRTVPALVAVALSSKVVPGAALTTHSAFARARLPYRAGIPIGP